MHKSAYGFNAIILAHDILSKHLYSRINNLAYVGFVSGNHDRVTASNEEDVYGEAAMAMEYIFRKDFRVDSEWSPLLLSKQIDGINYVCTHGHLRAVQEGRNIHPIRLRSSGYVQRPSNGHLHTRSLKTKSQVRYDDNDVIVVDSRDYRAIRLPSLFTNFYLNGIPTQDS